MSDAAPSPNHPSGNDSLPDEYGVPKVPCTDLGDSPSAQSAAADSLVPALGARLRELMTTDRWRPRELVSAWPSLPTLRCQSIVVA